MPRFAVLIPVSVASPKATPATATLSSARRMADVGLPSPRPSLHFSAALFLSPALSGQEEVDRKRAAER